MTLTSPRARRALWAAAGIGVAVLLIGLVIGILKFVALTQAVRDTQIEGTPTGKKLVAASDRILDCTTPEGQCFKDSQQRTAQAVADVNRVVIIAAACSAGLPPGMTVEERQDEIQACVIDRLALQAAKS